MIRALIVEDEENASLRLQKLLKEINQDVEIVESTDTISHVVDFINSGKEIDLIFLDIQLADGLSFEIFEKVKVNVPIIFTTAYDQYALKAFELNSIDYLLKPIDKNKLEKSIFKYKEVKEHYSAEKLSDQIQNMMLQYKGIDTNYKTRFLIPKADELVPVHVDDIAFFFAEDKAVFLVNDNEERFIINFSLDQLENSLEPKKFFRINRHQIIAGSNISKIHNYFNYRLKLELNINLEQEFIVSKAKVSGFKNWLS